MNRNASDIVIEIAKALIDALNENEPDWKGGYIRFEASDGQYGSNGSYVTAGGVFLIDPFVFGNLLDRVNERGIALREALSDDVSKFCVFLLTVDSAFNYKIDFEKINQSKWKISKLDGASGLPEGL